MSLTVPTIVGAGALAIALAALAPFSTASAGAADAPRRARVYVGTYTNTGSKGIYRFDLDLTTGEPSGVTLAAESTSPSFLAIDPGRKFLYAVGEVDKVGGKPGGGVSAFAIDPATGALSALNQQSSVGAGPCHIIVDKQGRNVLVANYGGGSTAVLPILEGGKVGEASAFVQHTGSSVNPQRQKEPHAHSVNLDPAGKFAFVADLGLDKVLIYQFDSAQGRITANQPSAASVAPGAGPRHFDFHPNGKFAYVINELNSTVTAFAYDAERGALRPIDTKSTLPEGFQGTNYPADVHVHPNGRFLYGSNRGHDSIASFTVDPETGALSPTGHQGEGIKNPRNFGVAPCGQFVLVANQDADSILVFAVDPATGALSPTGKGVKVPRPVCVQFVPIETD
ncbi:MAG: lactonase family protein [Isosphaeraceae bacterium]